MVTPLFRDTLKRTGVLDRVRASALCDVYRQHYNTQFLTDRAAQIAFYRQFIQPGSLVFDIGANVGDKADVFLRLGARVIAVDPDDANVATLTNRFHKYRLRAKPVTIIGKAVSEDDTPKTFFVASPGSALNTLDPRWAAEHAAPRTVPSTTLDALIAEYGVPAYIKIDVEGHEASVLNGLSRPVPLSFEVNMPQFKEDAIASVRRLAQLGGVFAVADEALTLGPWLTSEAFVLMFRRLPEQTVEVFWRP